MEFQFVKKIITIQIFLMGFYNVLYSQAPVEDWSLTFGGINNESAFDVQQTSDDGYIVAGYTNSYGSGENDIFLVKTDMDGNELWSQTYGGVNDEVAYAVVETNSGGFAVVGKTFSYGSGYFDVFLLRTDAVGNELWLQVYGGADFDHGRSIQQTSDNGFIIVGETYSYGAGISDVYLIKTDENGNVEWEQTFGGADAEEGYHFEKTSDGGFIIIGDTSSYGEGETDAYLVKIDSDGNELWYNTFGGSNWDHARHVQETSDGNFIITGYSWSDNAGHGYDIILILTDTEGNLIWEQVYDGTNSDYAKSVKQTPDGGYIIGGYSDVPASNSDLYLVRVDANGTIIWDQRFGGTADEYGGTATITNDFSYIIVGATNSYGNGGNDGYIVKTTQDPNLGVEDNFQNLSGYALSQNHPNPFSESTSISYFLPYDAVVSICIYDIHGKKVKTVENKLKSKGKNYVCFEAKDLKNGVYYYSLYTDNALIETKKLVIIR